MPAGFVEYEVDRGIAVVTLDSPANRNALSAALVGGLTECLARAHHDTAVRAVVLTHAGTVFCSGADLREQVSEGGPEAGTRRLVQLLQSIVELPKPVIARVDGAVRAGGIGVVGACDVAVATVASTFAFTEVRLGLTPAVISLTTLNRMTERAAGRYYLTGERFDGAAAAQAGLLTDAAADPASLDTVLGDMLDAIRVGSPQGLAATKQLLTTAVRAAFDERAVPLQSLSAALFASDEAREGMSAFLQKRRPSWVGL